MTLREKQSFFTTLVAELICHASTLGYQLTFGECYRSPEEAARLAKAGKGIKRSLHCDRLAIDVNLFIDGQYRSDTESYRELGRFWESLHPECAWGGHFADGNHFSLSHEGRK